MNDYIKNKFASEELADHIRKWWHSRGHKEVQVWVEEQKLISSFGTKLPSNYFVRSNISMNVASIPNGVIE